MEHLFSFLVLFLVIVPSAVLHEYMHGWVADQLGDGTARYAGRLTLNPIVHIDLFSTILMPLALYLASGGAFLFASAKPVPYNPYNLSRPRLGPILVALAGPLSNLALAITFALFLRVPAFAPYVQVLSLIVYANVILAVFNSVPVPPLDGSKILFALLPARFWKVQEVLERHSLIILLVFVFAGAGLISPIIQQVYHFLVTAPLSFT